jgi:hypothetical protein
MNDVIFKIDLPKSSLFKFYFIAVGGELNSTHFDKYAFFSFFEQNFYCAECANIAEFANIAEIFWPKFSGPPVFCISIYS